MLVKFANIIVRFESNRTWLLQLELEPIAGQKKDLLPRLKFDQNRDLETFYRSITKSENTELK